MLDLNFNLLRGDKYRHPQPTGNIAEPWYTLDMIALLEELLKPSWLCFEWGSGASTPWIASRVAKLTSIEHSRKWHRLVTTVLPHLYITNVDLRLIERARAYRYAIDGEGMFDAVFVDGVQEHRMVCVQRATDHVRPGGFILVDDFGGKRLEAVSNILGGWHRVDTSNGHRSTTIFIKPRPRVLWSTHIEAQRNHKQPQ